jgi:hypothetical protein
VALALCFAGVLTPAGAQEETGPSGESFDRQALLEHFKELKKARDAVIDEAYAKRAKEIGFDIDSPHAGAYPPDLTRILAPLDPNVRDEVLAIGEKAIESSPVDWEILYRASTILAKDEPNARTEKLAQRMSRTECPLEQTHAYQNAVHGILVMLVDQRTSSAFDTLLAIATLPVSTGKRKVLPTQLSPEKDEWWAGRACSIVLSGAEADSVVPFMKRVVKRYDRDTPLGQAMRERVETARRIKAGEKYPWDRHVVE